MNKNKKPAMNTDAGNRNENRLNRMEEEVKKAVSDGFELSGFYSPQVTDIANPNRASWKNAARELGLFSDKEYKGLKSGRTGTVTEIGVTTEIFGQQYMYPTPVTGCGSEGRGYIPWGFGNRLPREIYRLAGSLPYTASALRYLSDLASGLGPRLMYRYTRYAGQSVTEKMIPYESAGVLLRNLIAEARRKLQEEGNEYDSRDETDGNASRQDVRTFVYPYGDKVSYGKEETEDAVGTPQYELKRLKREYTIWEKTMEEWVKFSEDNNISLHYQQCLMDDMHLDMYFPTVGLSQGTTGRWDAKIVKIGWLPAICTRLEEMDESLRINYVYYSEKWRQEGFIDNPQKNDIVAYPTLMPGERLSRLRKTVTANQKTPLKSRPTWFCCPNYYPSGSRAYYQLPAWWSIFTSLVYNYAATLVTDKAIARKNATMWGKLIFINLNYLKACADSLGINDKKEMKALKDSIVGKINDFLKSRENNGKTCAMETMVGPDGKTLVDSVRIVDVPQMSSGSDTKTELEEISSIIFFALGVHPALVGAIPGRAGSNGGTFQRELHLLKQNQMIPRQKTYLDWLNDIARFNGWDEHARFCIEMPVLTTLDRSATGVETTMTE